MHQWFHFPFLNTGSLPVCQESDCVTHCAFSSHSDLTEGQCSLPLILNVKTYSIPENSCICNEENLFLGTMPKYVVGHGEPQSFTGKRDPSTISFFHNEIKYLSPVSNRNLRLEIRFRVPLLHTTTLIVYACYKSILEINSKWQVLVDYYWGINEHQSPIGRSHVSFSGRCILWCVAIGSVTFTVAII